MNWLLVVALILNLWNVFAQNRETIELPVLGRGQLDLGTLYDMKRDQAVVGPKFWNQVNLANFFERQQRKTEFEIVASDNVDEKETSFNVNANLKLSFLSGLLKVSGSAAYLDNRAKTSNTARVSLKFDTRTFVRELNPKVFTQLDYPDVLDKVDATHVVVGIEYGAAAVFVFDRTISKNETKRDVEGSMSVAVKSLPGIGVEGGARVRLSSQEMSNIEKFSCTFHGDFTLDNHPGTYTEAVAVYKELPKLLGENFENAVPMTVWLHPIDALPINRVNTVLHDIRNSLIYEVTVEMDCLNGLERGCEDMVQTGVLIYHERVRQNLDTFLAQLRLYTLIFKQNLADILPVIRDRGDAQLLTTMLANKESSVFSKTSLNSWIRDAKEEVSVLETTHNLPNYCQNDGQFTEFLLNSKEYTFALTLRLDEVSDSFLREIANYTKKISEQNRIISSSDYKPYLGKPYKWWTDKKLLSDLQQKSSSFKSFYDLEKDMEDKQLKSNKQFVVREINVDKGGRRITIELFKNAKKIDADYLIPTNPGKPRKINASYDFIEIEWKEPASGGKNVQYYEIDAHLLQGYNETLQFVKVKTVQTEGKVEKMKISSLMADKSYFFTVSVFSELGKTAISTQSNFIQTTSCLQGTHLSKDGCILCKPGHYSKSIGVSSCLKCPMGTYSDTFGSKECKQCPRYTTTAVAGARDKSDCGGELDTKINSLLLNETIDRLRNQEMVLQAQIYNIETLMSSNKAILVQNHDFRVSTAFVNKKWADYAKGFGKPFTGEYWIGLRKLHNLTLQSSNWNIVFQVRGGVRGGKDWSLGYLQRAPCSKAKQNF